MRRAMRTWTRATWGVAGLLLCGAPSVGRAEGCRVELQGGEVKLPAGTDPVALGGGGPCVAALVAAVAERPLVRSVTVTAMATDEDLANGKALKGAKAIQDQLVGGGMDATRVASVTMRVTDAKTTSYKLLYRELPAMPLAAVSFAEGGVKVSAAGAAARDVKAGMLLRAGEELRTDGTGHAAVALNDGHVVRMVANSRAVLREVKAEGGSAGVMLEVLEGSVEVEGDGKPVPGSLQIRSGAGVAAVRGTAFRMALQQADGAARVETLGGQVDLASERTVEVRGGNGSRVFKDGKVEDARPLLVAPRITGGFKGPLGTDGALMWAPDAAAARYVVQVGLDPDLQVSRQEWVVTEPRFVPPASLASGVWFWTVLAEDKDGFRGMRGKMFTFEK